MYVACGTDVARYAVRIFQALRNGYVPVLVTVFVAKMHIAAVFEAIIQAKYVRVQISSNERSRASIVSKPTKDVLANLGTQICFSFSRSKLLGANL